MDLKERKMNLQHEIDVAKFHLQQKVETVSIKNYLLPSTAGATEWVISGLKTPLRTLQDIKTIANLILPSNHKITKGVNFAAKSAQSLSSLARTIHI